MKLAKTMIETAKVAGADVVKFQLYDPEKLLDRSEFSEEDWEAILASRLTRRQVQELDQTCQKEQIELLFSVFDLERLQWTEEIKVKRYKIASRSVFDEKLCKAILATGKPVIISDGWIKPAKIQIPRPSHFTQHKARNQMSWLYCVSSYPTALEELDLNRHKFRKKGVRVGVLFEEWQGFSDHTIGITAAVVAMSLGARIVEKHFTMDSELPGPDHICSATPEELASLCKFRDDIERILYK